MIPGKAVELRLFDEIQAFRAEKAAPRPTGAARPPNSCCRARPGTRPPPNMLSLCGTPAPCIPASNQQWDTNTPEWISLNSFHTGVAITEVSNIFHEMRKGPATQIANENRNY